MSTTIVNTNTLALNSHRALKTVDGTMSKASTRLSSGLKISSGGDDAAGLAISEKMRAQIRGLDMASKNSQDAISLLQVADGGLSEIDNMVQRIRELTVQAGNETNQIAKDDADEADTLKIAKEASQLILEIDAMAGRTEFNKKKLLVDPKASTDELMAASTTTQSFHMQVGANATQKLDVRIKSITSASLSLVGGSATSSATTAIYKGGSAASAFLACIDASLKVVTDERASIGAYQNRLEYTIKSLDVASENTSSAESRIRDADMASEMMNFSKAQVLQQAATSMLSQANQSSQNILQLLR